MASFLRSVKNKKYSDIENLVRNATSNEEWGASSTELQEIAKFTNEAGLDYDDMFSMIMKRVQDIEQPRHVLKSLILIEYVMRNGSERFVTDICDHVGVLKKLLNQKFLKGNKDSTSDIHRKVDAILLFIKDKSKLAEARASAKNLQRNHSVMGIGNDDSTERTTEGGTRRGSVGGSYRSTTNTAPAASSNTKSRLSIAKLKGYNDVEDDDLSALSKNDKNEAFVAENTDFADFDKEDFDDDEFTTEPKQQQPARKSIDNKPVQQQSQPVKPAVQPLPKPVQQQPQPAQQQQQQQQTVKPVVSNNNDLFSLLEQSNAPAAAPKPVDNHANFDIFASLNQPQQPQQQQQQQHPFGQQQSFHQQQNMYNQPQQNMMFNQPQYGQPQYGQQQQNMMFSQQQYGQPQYNQQPQYSQYGQPQYNSAKPTTADPFDFGSFKPMTTTTGTTSSKPAAAATKKKDAFDDLDMF